MNLLKTIAPLAVMMAIVVTSYSQRVDSTRLMKYTLPESLDPSKPAINYTIVKPPQPGDAYSQVERVVIRLKGDAGKKTSSGRISIPLQLEQQQQQFISDLRRIETRANVGRNNAVASEIRHQYKRVFNGFALTTSRGIREELEKLDYVASVSEDREVKMHDIQSSEIINAPKVWSTLNVTGKGITIGIIDTGIDYNHPDLGGGFGPSFKVIGGYDFVNDDNNPIDDHGHGTHVAGIAAANGPGLKGVAPDAKLVAYKVLSASGFGNDSGILAAIERAVDPDQNPNTNDALDVVNMSLGRQPDPLEPMSEAVNNAVSMGVVFVVAAGNNYGFVTVGTPGVAEKAITVAATNNSDITADFSSRGPVEKDFSIKPDVAAPGVDIYSSVRDGGYQNLSGTSMASPHVAGAVALILEKHPTWTPAVVKGSLMNTAKASFDWLWAQGSGRIDVFDAINTEFVVTPGSFSFGKPDKSSSTWTKTIKAKVFNLSNNSRSFSLAIEGFNNTFISTTISPATFTLNGNSSREVDVKVTVSALALPQQSFPELYSGNLVTTSSSKEVRSPIALVNPQVTKLVIDGELPGVVTILGIEGTNFFKFVFPTTNEQLLYLPLGKYDFVSQYPGNRMVVSEGIQTDVDRTIQQSAAQAKNLIVFKPRDKNGNQIPITMATLGTALFSGKERNLVTFYPYAEDSFYISDQSVYRYDMKIHGMSPGDADHYYEVSGTTGTGITQSMTCTNDPTEFFALNINNPSVRKAQRLQFNMVGGPFTTWNNEPVNVTNPFNLLTSKVSPDHQLNSAYARFLPAGEDPGYIWETSVWKCATGNTLTLKDKIGYVYAEYNTESFDYNLGESLLRFVGPTFNAPDRVAMMDVYYNGVFNRYHGERERGTIYYKLFDNGQIISQGNFANYVMSDISSSPSVILPASAKPYRLNLTYDDYQVQGKFGHANVDIFFDNSQADMNPPYIRSLKLDVNGKSTNRIAAGEEGKLSLILDDSCWDPWGLQVCNSSWVSSAIIKIRRQGDLNWTTVPYSDNGWEFNAELPGALQAGYYELKIDITDGAGNRSESHLNPGFLVGEPTSSTPYVTVTLLEPRNKAIDAGTKPRFRWSEITNTSEYNIQIATSPDFENTLVLDTQSSSNTFELAFDLEADKTYYWRVRANSSSDHPWSSVHSFFSGTLYAPILLQPSNNQTQVSNVDVLFKWEAAHNASAYLLEVWRDEQMSDLAYSFFTQETSHIAGYLSGSTQYFWRVQSLYFTIDYTYYMPSTINRFTTGVDTGMDDEVAREFYNYPNPFASQTKFVIVAKNTGAHTLSVKDAMGKPVRTMSAQIATTNEYEIVWDGKDDSGQHVSPGVYFVQLRTPTGIRNLKLLVQR